MAEELWTDQFNEHCLGAARTQAGKLEPDLRAALCDDLARLTDRAGAIRMEVSDVETALLPAPTLMEPSRA